MAHLFQGIKKIIFFILCTACFSTLCVSPTQAAALGGPAAADVNGIIPILKAILIRVDEILKRVNDLPAYIVKGTEFIEAWMKEDKSDNTSMMAENFPKYANSFISSSNEQKRIQDLLLQGFVGPPNQPIVQHANDLIYQNLIREKDNFYIKPDPRTKKGSNEVVDPILSYIKTASGLNVSHIIPDPAWRGPLDSKLKYQKYFNAVSSVQTFNAYILSQLYGNYQTGDETKATQQELIKKINDPNWFPSIATEDLGAILRQILLFNSQIFLLMTHILQTEKDMLTAQTMTNTLLIVGNLMTEDVLVRKANGTMD